MVEIANVVGAGDLGLEVDIEELGADLAVPYTEYDPENYHGLYVRLEEDGPLITLYRTGKYIISGCSGYEQLRGINEGFLEKLRGLEVITDTVDTGFSVQNVVCTATLGEDVALNALSIGLGLESTEYEPEQFSGLIYRPSEIDAVLLVFANGKVVITGARDLSTAESAFDHLQANVRELIR